MTSRREFVQLATRTATAAMLASAYDAAAEQKGTERATLRRGLPLLDLQQRFVDLRFGMFVHFNMATFPDREWGDPTSPADLFRPTALDTDQWAGSAQSANMTWGCLTTRHHDGFCLWPTKTAAASVGQTLYSTDVVRAYVNSFRKAGLRVGLYYSILSLRDDIRHFNVTPSKVQLIKDQLTELFTGYGEVDILITDGWDAPWSRITYEEVPFHEIYEHIKNLQPDCLICDLNARQYPPNSARNDHHRQCGLQPLAPLAGRIPAPTSQTMTHIFPKSPAGAAASHASKLAIRDSFRRWIVKEVALLPSSG